MRKVFWGGEAWVLIGLFLVVIAANRMWMGTTDTQAYLEFFDEFESFEVAVRRFEPGFVLVASQLKFFNVAGFYFLLVIASIGIGLKIFAIRMYAPFAALSLAVYLSKYFVLQDMVQIRAGVATAIFLLSIKYIKKRNFIAFSLSIAFACLFHYSALIYIIIYFISSNRLTIRLLFFVMIGVLLINYFYGLNIFFINLAANYFNKVKINMELISILDPMEFKNLNIELILNCIIFSLFLYYSKLLAFKYQYFEIWFKSYSLGIFFSLFFLQFPVFSFRISEMLLVTSIFIFPLIIVLFRDRIIGYGVFWLLNFAIGYNYYIKQEMF